MDIYQAGNTIQVVFFDIPKFAWTTMIRDDYVGKWATPMYQRGCHIENTRDNFACGVARLSPRLAAASCLLLEANTRVEYEGWLGTDTIMNLLHRCIDQKDFVVGTLIHSLMIRDGHEGDEVLERHLIQMYASCGQVREAKRVFCKLVDPDVSAWTVMISVHTKLGRNVEAIKIYHQMRKANINPDGQLFVTILKACTTLKSLSDGKDIHSCIIESGCEQDIFVGSCLIDMFTKCGSLHDGCRLFQRLPRQNIVTWNTLIAGFVQHGYGEEALQIVAKIYEEGLEPNEFLLACILKACTCVDQGRIMHSFISEKGFEHDHVIGNSLVNMYSKCGAFEDAHLILDSLSEPNWITWSSLISGYVQRGHYFKAYEIFCDMQEHGLPLDPFTYASILKSCSKLYFLELGRQLHACVTTKGWEKDSFIINNLIELYAACGEFNDAWSVFRRVSSQSAVTCNILMKECIQQGHVEDAYFLFKQMQNNRVPLDESSYLCAIKACYGRLEEGKDVHFLIMKDGLEWDIKLATALFNMYIKCGSLDHAQRIFDRSAERDAVMWSTLLVGYAQLGHSQQTLEIFEKMQEADVEVNRVVCIGLLKTCLDLDWGRLVHGLIVEHVVEVDAAIGNALIDMYARFAGIQESSYFFSSLVTRDVFTWTAWIGGCVALGYGNKALDLFWQMQHENVVPNEVTFLCVLRACSSISAAQEGKAIHGHIIENSMEMNTYISNILIDMYASCRLFVDAIIVFDSVQEKDTATWNSLIGGYARFGYDHDAFFLFQQMEQQGMEPDGSTMIFILKSCSSLMSVERGIQIHKCIVEKGLEIDGYVSNALIDMYAKCGNMADAMIVFEKMQRRDIMAWSAMIAAVQLSDYRLTQQYFVAMQNEGLHPDDVTFISLLSACCHARLVDEGCKHLKCMIEDHGIMPRVKHLNAIVHLLGRTRQFDEAEDLLESLPFRTNCVGWTSLLDCCKEYACVIVGRRCFDYLKMADPSSAASYVLMSCIYYHAGMPIAAKDVQNERRQACAWKKLANATIEVDNVVHSFIVGDKSNSKIDEIHMKLKSYACTPD